MGRPASKSTEILNSFKGAERAMTSPMRKICSTSLFAVFLLATPFLAGAQQKAVPATLRQSSNSVPTNETVLQGTVVSYTENSTGAPLGAHVVIQTSSGEVDVHLGNAAILKANNISLSAGDSVRITGSSTPYGEGTFFAARILQKGSQSAVLRNARGIPLRSAQTRAAVRAAGIQAQGGPR